MYAKPDGTESDLLGYWSFDDGSASDASLNAILGWFYDSSSQTERITFPATLQIAVSDSVSIGFQTVQDALYTVLSCTDLMGTNWVPVVTDVAGTGAERLVTDTNMTFSVGLYRVLSL